MILAELEINDYKQFVGEHRFTPPPEAIVGIIGPNGAGKTTLFEAIEWCLYNPREIAADEIPPRGRSSKPRVKVVLHDPQDNVRYVVERTLKRGVSNAEIYREDDPESRIVHGPRQVTEYVARRLIGLDHRAFVSTFFTRQKELTFFGTMRETERRREVGRLLGLETIRDAQKLIADDRSKARAEAAGLVMQHEEQTTGRDFATETAAAEAAIAEHAGELGAAEAALETAATTLATVRDRLAMLRDLERRDHELRRALVDVAGDERAAIARRDAVSATLTRLDQAAANRANLLPIAAAEIDRASLVIKFEAERERHRRAQQVTSEIARAGRGLSDAARDLKRAVTESKAASIPGWTWTAADAADPIAAADRLLGVAQTVDAISAAERAAGLEACFRLVTTRNEALAKLNKYEALFADLEKQRSALRAAGDPEMAMADARAAREAALQARQDAIATAQHNRDTLVQLEPIVTNLRSHHFEDRCPTCARPFTPAEVALTLAAVEDRIDGLRQKIAALEKQRAEHEKRAKASEQAEQEAAKRQSEVVNISGRIEQGRPMVDEQRALWDKTKRDCEDALAAAGLNHEPSQELVADARAEANVLSRVAAAVPVLMQLRGAAHHHATERMSAESDLAALGDIAYDDGAHTAAITALTAARDAAATIRQIESDLADRPEHEQILAAALAELERTAADRARLDESRTALGFSEQALSAAVDTERTAIAAERAALVARSVKLEAQRETLTARDRLLAEIAHLAHLIERADARSREADQLDVMYREFTLFEQYVARRVTPQLADHTSELLAAVTEGKYDRVDFDENYGIEVYDGADEKFPMEEFSGGERDVIALCARLALSRLIGSQAHNPPGFLVLDEVFGALDRERRAQVLETLAALAGTADAFHQLFIISHVDDVRAAPIFNEVWRVNETAEGVSTLENLTESGAMEDV